ncbi:uncharacterized protein EAF02_000774 [Botrytis sinoallii]|uniref:uncharacterized protein n=1 Tax=Botrytis sinoallii TaxID=1463999 RepID=UPI00190079D8|nr:uncharacterized protein EAF02_000774 [Botrytis sinoallii]KAF7893236.1 hypothetical protein EAF02_000774 [Botrytis sinoallii]
MVRVPANVGAQNPPILNSPDTFKSTKNNIPALPDLPSSCIYDEFNSTTGDIIDSTKKRDELPGITRAELSAKANVVATEIREFYGACREQIGSSDEVLAAMDNDMVREKLKSFDELLAAMGNDIARLGRQTEEVDKMASLVKMNMELELKVHMQSTKLDKLEDWRVEMRRMVSKWDAE